jgi:hypothetical protein
MRRHRDPMERLAAADPLRDGEQLTPEEEREAEALLARLLATPVGPATEERRARRPRLRRLALAAAGVACSAAAAFAAINLVDSDGPALGPGVVERAVAAVTQDDSVYHVLERTRATGNIPEGFDRTVYFESWYTTDGRIHRKTFAASGERRGRLLGEEAGRRRPGRQGGRLLRYVPGQNSITEGGFGRAPDADAVPDIDPFGDPGAQLRALQEQGRLRLAGTTQVEGRRAHRLVSDATTRWRSFAFERVEYLVDYDTYLPLSLRVTARVDSEQTHSLLTRYLIYERLPLNARSRALLALDPHPGAECSPFAGDEEQRDLGFANPCPPSD